MPPTIWTWICPALSMRSNSTTIDLCLSMFPWAHFRSTKAAVKMHTLLDLRGNIPSFIHISDGKLHDVHALDMLLPEPGAIYVMDRGYVDFARLHVLNEAGAFFVTRAKSNIDAHRVYSAPADRSAGVISDQTIAMDGYLTQRHYPAHLRRIRFKDPETGKTLMLPHQSGDAVGFDDLRPHYHYWFAGRRVLERPFNEVLALGQPNFPFCLCWANETWTGVWYGASDRTLIEQTYPGPRDHEQHFAALLPAFRDRRYVLVDGKPLFVIFRPRQLPSPIETLSLWRSMAETSGLPGLYIAGIGDDGWKPQTDGFDAKIVDHGFSTRPWGSLRHPVQRLRHKIQFLRSIPTVQSYRKYAEVEALTTRLDNDAYQCVVHAWDNTPRSGRLGLVLEGSTPDLFGALFRRAVKALQNRPPETRILFLKSWNEWAEGNHLEPDLRYGHAYLNVIREIIFD